MVSMAACPIRKRSGIGMKAAALALSCGLAFSFCLPSQAFAASNFHMVNSVVSTAESIVSASAAAQAAAVSDAAPTSKTLVYNVDAVAGVETQVETGHTSCCLAFSQALGDTIMTGETVDHTEFAYSGDCAWDPCASYGDWTEYADDLSAVYSEINAGRPVVVFVTGNGFSHHWVLAVGYCDVDDPSDMSLDNLVIIDPWDGETMVATDRFSDYGELVLTAKTESVAS